MNIRKSMGPRIEPWGTPVETKKEEEDWPSKTTLRWRSWRKERMIYMSWESFC